MKQLFKFAAALLASGAFMFGAVSCNIKAQYEYFCTVSGTYGERTLDSTKPFQAVISYSSDATDHSNAKLYEIHMPFYSFTEKLNILFISGKYYDYNSYNNRIREVAVTGSIEDSEFIIEYNDGSIPVKLTFKRI